MLVLAATPIGHLSDASPRLADTLASADVIAAEDTRRIKRLLSKLEVESTGRIVSYFEGNEQQRTNHLLDELRAGSDVVVVTDAGMPGISDPGYRIVTAAVQAGFDVTAVPGPSAVPAALAISGLPVDRFCFEGFLPRKAAERDRKLSKLSEEERTMVFFEAPHRTMSSLEAMAREWGGDRQAVVCRELTKVHEEIQRGALNELVAWGAQQAHGIRGEITIVAAGADANSRTFDARELRERVDDHEARGLSRKDAIALVAQQTGVRRRIVYEAAHQ